MNRKNRLFFGDRNRSSELLPPALASGKEGPTLKSALNDTRPENQGRGRVSLIIRLWCRADSPSIGTPRIRLAGLIP